MQCRRRPGHLHCFSCVVLRIKLRFGVVKLFQVRDGWMAGQIEATGVAELFRGGKKAKGFPEIALLLHFFAACCNCLCTVSHSFPTSSGFVMPLIDCTSSHQLSPALAGQMG